MQAGLLSHSLFAAAPLMMNQVDIEMEMPVVNRQPAPVMMKQGDAEMGMPVVNMQPAPVTIESDNITSADLVSRTA